METNLQKQDFKKPFRKEDERGCPGKMSDLQNKNVGVTTEMEMVAVPVRYLSLLRRKRAR